jgi:hypothetical protein
VEVSVVEVQEDREALIAVQVVSTEEAVLGTTVIREEISSVQQRGLPTECQHVRQTEKRPDRSIKDQVRVLRQDRLKGRVQDQHNVQVRVLFKSQGTDREQANQIVPAMETDQVRVTLTDRVNLV